jgi:hypothetical protein
MTSVTSSPWQASAKIRYLAIDNLCQYISNNDETDKEDFKKLKEVVESMKALQEMSATQ